MPSQVKQNLFSSFYWYITRILPNSFLKRDNEVSSTILAFMSKFGSFDSVVSHNEQLTGNEMLYVI